MSAQNIKDVLISLGYKLVDCGNHWRTSALYRGGNNPTAICVYKDTGTWIDYVKNSNALPFKSLISATIKSNDQKDIDKILGTSLSNTSNNSAAEKKSKHEKIYPESCLSNLIPHYSFYESKGISENILKELKGGLATQGSMYQRFVFPIYDKNYMIHGFSGRDMTNSKASKWKHVGSKTSWIYPYFVKSEGVSITANSIRDKNYVILVESIGDMLNLRENGIYNVLVTFGTSISSSLLCFLIGLNPKNIFISFNNDKDKEENRGKIGALKSYIKLIKHFDFKKISIYLPTENDFGDMSKEKINFWLKNIPIYKDNTDYKSLLNEYISDGHISKSSTPKKYIDLL